MVRPSKIDRLPLEIRDMISQLRESGSTIDEILAKLRELKVDVGRSGLGEHLKQWDKMAARLNDSRAVSEALIRRMEDDGAENRVARLNIAMAHASVLQLLGGAQDGEPVTLSPQESYFISAAIKNLTGSSKNTQDLYIVWNKEIGKKAKKAVEGVADEVAASGGKMDAAAVLKRIREEVYGIFEQ